MSYNRYDYEEASFKFLCNEEIQKYDLPEFLNKIKVEDLQTTLLRVLKAERFSEDELQYVIPRNKHFFKYLQDYSSVIHLIKNYKAGPKQALEEIKCLDKRQIEVLLALYDRGLRGEYLRDYWRPHENCQYLSDEHIKTLEELFKNKKFQDAPELAIQEISGLDKKQVETLRELYCYGLRSQHLRDWQPPKNCPRFEDEHSDMLWHLIADYKFSPEKAVKEINGLDKKQVHLLYWHHSIGLGEQLRNWQPFNDDCHFGEAHQDVVSYLLGERTLTPKEAIEEINGLDEREATILLSLYPHWLRGEHLRNCRPNGGYIFNEENEKAFIHLVDECWFKPEKALKLVIGLNKEEANKFIGLDRPKAKELAKISLSKNNMFAPLDASQRATSSNDAEPVMSSQEPPLEGLMTMRK